MPQYFFVSKFADVLRQLFAKERRDDMSAEAIAAAIVAGALFHPTRHCGARLFSTIARNHKIEVVLSDRPEVSGTFISWPSRPLASLGTKRPAVIGHQLLTRFVGQRTGRGPLDPNQGVTVMYNTVMSMSDLVNAHPLMSFALLLPLVTIYVADAYRQ
jgi:hypothetical protein